MLDFGFRIMHHASTGHGSTTAYGAALFALGFRPFFIGASALAVVSMGIWLGVYGFDLPLNLGRMASPQWHAHELIFGYALAVIAGFLLTAVKNWTGVHTPQGWRLGALFSLWAAARISFFLGDPLIAFAAVADLLFLAALCASTFVPIWNKKQWRQTAILSKLALIGVGNIVFYAGALGYLEQGMRWGLYTGLYLVLGLILTMGRRVIPEFIERGVGYPVKLRNRRWVDLSSMVLFVMFFLLDVFTPYWAAAGLLALALLALHALRAAGWYTAGIWRKPLLWSLYLAYVFIVVGFAVYALNSFLSIGSYFLAIHTFSVGGIGLVTISMMARVSLGHTGRDVHNPPRLLNWAFVPLVVALLFRVLMPLVVPQHYSIWVTVSALLWILGFMVFFCLYFPILTRRRVDGLPG